MGLAASLGCFFALSPAAHAQILGQSGYGDDALLYMRQNPSGTARTLGLGGASSSLGADFSNLTSNPAGLGFFTKSEVTLTPAVGYGTTTSTQVANGAALGTSFPGVSQTANSFHLANAGVVFASRRPDNQAEGWRGGSFALGFTRLADFNQGFRYQNSVDDNHSFFQRLREPYGYSDYTSSAYQAAADDIYQQFVDTRQAGTTQYTNIDGLAYGTGLVDQIVDPVTKLVRLGTPAPTSTAGPLATARKGTITQNEVVQSKGSLSQFDLGYGGNFRDRLYIGLGLGIVSMNRTRTASFSESSAGVQDFQSDDYLRTTGTGINGRLGLIYRAADAVRFGASIQTPTYISLSDEYSTTLTANTKYATTGTTPTLSTAPGQFDYSITTPFRANGGATVLVGKYGFLTGDVEYVGYSKASFRTSDGSSDTSLNDGNSFIASNYRNSVNYKVGAEGRFTIFRARVGYAYYADPYRGSAADRSQQYFTGGLGVRTKAFFVDVAGVFLTSKEQYQPYRLATRPAPTVDIANNRFTASLTGGLLF